MTVHNITQLSEIKECTQPMVLQFSAEWCGPCKMIAPEIETLAQNNSSIKFCKIDVDKCVDIAKEYGIQSMPTFIFIKNGKELERFSGANKIKVEACIENLKS